MVITVAKITDAAIIIFNPWEWALQKGKDMN